VVRCGEEDETVVAEKLGLQIRGRRWWWLLRFAGEDDWLRFYFDPRQKWNFMASGNNRGQKGCLLASPQYASVPDPRQNEENNRGKKLLL